MKFLFEMFPIILFFAAFKYKDIYFATVVAIAASILQISYSYIKNKKHIDLPQGLPEESGGPSRDISGQNGTSTRSSRPSC